MDLVANLMNANQPLARITVPTAQVDGVMIVESDEDNEYEEFIQAQRRDEDRNYAKRYQKQEEELYIEATITENELQDGAMSTIDHAEDLLSSIGRLEIDCIKEEELRGVYSKYSFDKHRTAALTIDSYRNEILSLIQTNQVVVIQGPTGCGKTTQVPQFILDDCRDKDKACKIVVTQPRRIAAISIARRVCEERGWGPGTICGFQVGLERELSPDTLLSYVTTGVLLQKLIRQKNLREYTHIVVDEVHERNQDMDFLLLIIRRFLNTNSINTRVVLMSATFNTEEFAQYFKNFHHAQLIPAPVIYVSKMSPYNTQIYYVDQLQQMGQIPYYSYEEPKVERCLSDIFARLVHAFDRLDPVDPLTNRKKIGHVLVFLPGILEIEEAHDKLLATSKLRSKNATGDIISWLIIPLHSSITTEEQRRVFQIPPPGERKIILSTNIAESSITVPDIFYVVDFCLTKTMIMDPDTQYQSLQLQWASQENCVQRSGRVGRVADGRVYRLVTRTFFDGLPKSAAPEILRAPLNQLVLNAKMLELNEPPKAILALCMNPPDLHNIDNTVLYLKEVGGLAMTCNGQKMITDGDITFLGQVMATLPLDVHLSKFILLGHMFSCLNDCIIMATGCSLNIFKTPFKERMKAYTNRLQWADGSASDLISYLHLYKVWQKHTRINRDHNVEIDWCKRNYVSPRSLREWRILVKDVKDRLDRMHIRQSEGPGHVVLSQMEIPTVIKVVICGAFYPNYFKRSSDGGQVDEREAVRTLGGRDPFNTVYFTGFDPTQPGPVYVKSIKKLLFECGTDIQVSFDSSSKVYVQFMSPDCVNSVNVDGQEFITGMPGKIRADVYRSVRLRQLRVPNRIALMKPEQAWELAKSQSVDGRSPQQLPILRKLLKKADSSLDASEPSIIPSLDIQYILISISEIIDAGHFWAHSMAENTRVALCTMDRVLNTTKLEPATRDSVTMGGLFAAKYQEDNKFYRCKVLSLNPFGKSQSIFVQIIYIDYGNASVVSIDQLFKLPQAEVVSKPPQAMECFLSEVQPSVVLNPRALWIEQANFLFDKETRDKILCGKVYSVVNGVVHLELHKYDPKNERNCEYEFKDSLNAWLIRKGFAQHAVESFLSKENHLKRLQVLEMPDKLSAFQKEEDSLVENLQEVEHPPDVLYTNSVELKGPFSPLEMQIYSVVNSGAVKRVSIEANSVNAVLLDIDPQDPHERLVVAAHIGQNPSGTVLSLRHTTVMPNVHGFPMLMSLLFCPTMEPKPTEDGTCIGAILCGLGAHENSYRSIFPPHDICLRLDVELTDHDINDINELRYWMNMSIQSMELNYQEIPGAVEMSLCQREIKDRLFKLFDTKRESIDRVYIKHSNVWGKTLYDAEIMKPGDASTLFKSEIWPLHWTIKLNKDGEEQATFERHLNELEEVALQMKIMNEIVCNLCNQTFYSAGELRVHLASKQHNDIKNAHMDRF